MAKKPVVKAAEVKETKAVEVKPVAAKAAEVKPVEVKKEEPKKEVAKEVVKKAAAPKAVKKPATKKATKTTKVVSQPEVFVQYDDNGTQQASVADIVAKVKALYVAEGHRESSIKSLQVYMKPQEWKAYYVINGKVTGDVDLF